jgi:YHS domain-containing protein
MSIRRPRLTTSIGSVLVVLALFTGATATARAQASSREPLIPLEGLDPVMLSEGKEVQGDMKFKVTRGQFQYIFANAENKAIFEKDPSRYEIQLDGHCARMGAPTTGNPDLYTVHNGRIYIFGSESCQTLFKTAPEKYLEVPAAPKSPPTVEMVKRGDELLAKAVEALGGRSKLDQLVSFQIKDVRENQVRNTLLLTFPDVLRQETIRSNFTLVSVVTPSESFFLVNNAARPMPEADRKAFYKELNHELIVLLRARTRSDFKAWLSGSASEKGALELVDIELPGFTTTLAIDPATGRVTSQTYRGRGPGGVLGQIAINYSDFRTVDGLSLPFKRTAMFDGQPLPALSATIEHITINAQIDPASFKKSQ